MQYRIKIELVSMPEPTPGYNNEYKETVVQVKKTVEAESEKEAIQKVVDLVAEAK